MFYSATADHEISRSDSIRKMPNMHYHDSYELYYLEAGSREYFVEDKLFSVQAGDFVLIAPGKLHRTGGEYGMRTLVCFSEEFLLRTFTRSAAGELLRCFENLKIVPPENCQENCRRLLKQIFTSTGETDFALSLGMLLRELGNFGSTEISGDPVSAITAYINGNFAQIRSISQIAEQFYISKYHLCRVFKEAMKMTVVEYLNRVRIKNACQYLRMTDKEMGDIAHLCGFHDPAYFSNVFKKIIGQSPTAYRRGE